MGESTTLIVKILSGVLSDHLGKRKGLAVLATGSGAVKAAARSCATALPHPED